MAGAAVDLSAPALFFTAGVVAAAAVLFGLAPTRRSTRADLQHELKDGGRTASTGASHSRWRDILVIAEVSLALVLLAGAGLMMKSLFRLLSIDAGIRTEHVLTMQIDLRATQYDKDPAVANFWDRLLSGVGQLPGVRAVALGTGLPLTGAHSRTDISVDGMDPRKPGSYPHPDVHIVSPAYSSVLGLRLLRGRVFTDRDDEHVARVALINSLLARQLFSGRDPIGSRFHFGGASQQKSVPFQQAITGSMKLIVKSASDPSSLASAIRNVVASLDKDQPVFAVETMDQYVRDSISTRRITFLVLGCFSSLALVLAGVGIYGVISYSVSQRMREIGIRVALSAQSRDVLRMVLTQGGKIALAGVLIGIAASFCLTRFMTKLLFSISSVDPLTFIAVAGATLLTALLASYLPARRASRADPVTTLRSK